MSTFLIVVQGSYACQDSTVLSLLRNALVHRYGQLQEQLSENDEEIRDVLMVLREDIRTSKAVGKFSEWCAILDYFESQFDLAMKQQQGWVVWCGPIETIFGVFQASLSCTTEWTLGALHYWYTDIELEQFAIVHPHSRSVDDEQFDLTTLYGVVGGLREYDTLLLRRQHFNLEDDPENWQHYLVMRSHSYDEQQAEFFTPVLENDSALFCYWDYKEQTYDWEESLKRLGESVIRIMSRSIEEKGSFP